MFMSFKKKAIILNEIVCPKILKLYSESTYISQSTQCHNIMWYVVESMTY